MSDIYNLEMNAITGESVSFSDYREQAMLVVNLASQWGLTNQYAGLRTLQENNSKLRVLGFPCNQFGKQEPGDASQIQKFCELNFDVRFLLTTKIDVKGNKQHPIYKWLTSKDLNGKKNSSVKWNFQKYLVDENGILIDYFFSITKPMSSAITKHL